MNDHFWLAKVVDLVKQLLFEQRTRMLHVTHNLQTFHFFIAFFFFASTIHHHARRTSRFIFANRKFIITRPLFIFILQLLVDIDLLFPRIVFLPLQTYPAKFIRKLFKP